MLKQVDLDEAGPGSASESVEYVAAVAAGPGSESVEYVAAVAVAWATYSSRNCHSSDKLVVSLPSSLSSSQVDSVSSSNCEIRSFFFSSLNSVISSTVSWKSVDEEASEREEEEEEDEGDGNVTETERDFPPLPPAAEASAAPSDSFNENNERRKRK